MFRQQQDTYTCGNLTCLLADEILIKGAVETTYTGKMLLISRQPGLFFGYVALKWTLSLGSSSFFSPVIAWSRAMLSNFRYHRCPLSGVRGIQGKLSSTMLSLPDVSQFATRILCWTSESQACDEAGPNIYTSTSTGSTHCARLCPKKGNAA